MNCLHLKLQMANTQNNELLAHKTTNCQHLKLKTAMYSKLQIANT